MLKVARGGAIGIELGKTKKLLTFFAKCNIILPSKNMTKQTTDRQYYLFAIRIFADFGATIAVPVVIAVIIGQYLDEKYNQSPFCTIIAFVIAALLTAQMIRKKAKVYGIQYQNMVDSDIESDKKKKKEINKLINKDE